VSVIRGKDLRRVEILVGTGGPLVFSPRRAEILRQALYDPGERGSLRPVGARLYVDAEYAMFAFGLLGEVAPEMAVRMLRRYCRPLDEGVGNG
jgi:hypothetical protein